MRVLAIQSFKDKVLTIYGEGEYIGDKIPSSGPITSPNPCIKLDNGKYVWGYQCWWGNLEKAKERYMTEDVKVVTSEIENIIPKDE